MFLVRQVVERWTDSQPVFERHLFGRKVFFGEFCCLWFKKKSILATLRFSWISARFLVELLQYMGIDFRIN